MAVCTASLLALNFWVPTHAHADPSKNPRWGWEIEFGADIMIQLIEDVDLNAMHTVVTDDLLDEYVLHPRAFQALPLDLRIELTQGLAQIDSAGSIMNRDWNVGALPSEAELRQGLDNVFRGNLPQGLVRGDRFWVPRQDIEAKRQALIQQRWKQKPKEYRIGLINPNLFPPRDKVHRLLPANITPGDSEFVPFVSTSHFFDLEVVEIQSLGRSPKIWFELKQPDSRPLQSQEAFDEAIESVARRLRLEGELLVPRRERVSMRANAHLHLSVPEKSGLHAGFVEDLAWNYRRLKLLRLMELGTIHMEDMMKEDLNGYGELISEKSIVRYFGDTRIEDRETTLDLREESKELMRWMQMDPKRANAEINQKIRELAPRCLKQKDLEKFPALTADFFRCPRWG